MGDEADFDKIDFNAVLAEIDRKEAGLRAAERQLANVTANARSADGLVEVTVSPTGALTGLTLAPETFRRSTPQYLGRSVVEAAQQATRQVREAAKSAAAPLTELTRSISAAVDESLTPDLDRVAAPPSPGVEAESNNRMARVGVDALGIVAVVHISPDAYRGDAVGKLAAAITEAAERAARQMYETRMGAVESELDPEDRPNLDAFFPIHAAPDDNTPVAPPTPPSPPRPAPAPPKPVNRIIPGTRKPNRDQVVGPSDWDEDDGYGQSRQSWLV
ncbi:YbaB/EbfC family nucleoid-associated protein [Nocardia macrotermitis]|uniref:Nucleoid-associated protein YbaB n=1 Tax=Nocardia macrotermitis TaxID=2585198 RepID=A0A7K0D279_9NOCA|nr:YbaB/EbfC family nucleoid-associated protein [Nocardia macrotermitis]MQY19044.1 Nucleoid-associated protein YbaB [Nocardia macrotermitis]